MPSHFLEWSLAFTAGQVSPIRFLSVSKCVVVGQSEKCAELSALSVERPTSAPKKGGTWSHPPVKFKSIHD